jgi:transcriptional regulator with XRE-family HTH domain
MKHLKPLQPKHHIAAALLARGLSQAEVAERVAVAESTVGAWMKREDFRAIRDAEIRKYIGDIAPDLIQTLYAQSKRDGPNDQWLAQNAASRLLQLVEATLKQPAETKIQVFLGGAPDLGMPEPDAIEIEGEVE